MAHLGVAMAVLTRGDPTSAPVPEDICLPAMGQHVQVGTCWQKKAATWDCSMSVSIH